MSAEATPPSGDGADRVHEILGELVRVASVTPDVSGALDVVERHLASAGFEVHRPVFSSEGGSVENLFAAFGEGHPHLTLAGHVDVVPVGDEKAWSRSPFGAEIDGGRLFGRGSTDMKGGVAAMVCAARTIAASAPGGRISLLITGDEEGPAIDGTAKLLRWATERGERFDAAIVGEPTSLERFGDQIKVGRRGSYSVALVVEGRQGHAAYPQRADNPIRSLAFLLDALLSEPLDPGSEHFEPSTLEPVSADVGNSAWNVIPGRAVARLNSRYNDLWSRESLRAELERRVDAAAKALVRRDRRETPVSWRIEDGPTPSDVFLTRDERLIAMVSDAVEAETGRRPFPSTGGGTSDARFIKDYCPVVEFGTVGHTMHQVDEYVELSEVEALARIYERILKSYLHI